MATTKLPDTRPENTTIFEGQERKYFELTHAQDGDHQIPILPHRHLDSSLPCKVYLPHDPRCTRAIIEAFPAYAKWLRSLAHNLCLQSEPSHTFAKNPFFLKAIDLQAPTWFPNNKLGFLKAQCTVETDAPPGEKPQWIPGAVFLRGGSVGVLIIIQPYDDEPPRPNTTPDPELYSLLTLQPRLPTTSLSFPELPAGMLDSTGHLTGKAASELHEELGLTVRATDLFDMTAAAVSSVPQIPYLDSAPDKTTNTNTTSPLPLPKSKPAPERVANAMYPSPGGCDESLSLMLLQKRMRRRDIEALKGRETGLREEGEVIRVRVVEVGRLWREGGRDAKCLAALALYEGLKREGGLPGMPEGVDDEV